MKNSIYFICLLIISAIVLGSFYQCECVNTKGADSKEVAEIEEILEEEDNSIDSVTAISVSNQSSQGYFEIGPIDSYYTLPSEDGSFSYEGSDLETILYVKSYDGEKYYFIGINGKEKKYHVYRTKDNSVFNAYIDWGQETLYFNISAWGDASGSNSNNNSAIQSEPQRVVVEHHRDPQPVQEWVPCTGCNGSGKCFNCNGTGQNLYSTNYMSCVGCGGSGRCEFCAGQGGHYETRFR